MKSHCINGHELTATNTIIKKCNGRSVRRCRICWNLGELTYSKSRKGRHRYYMKMYNLSIDSYNYMFANQNGLCAICKKPESAKNKSLSVDHDHNTGKIRGLLCHRCNSGLGQFMENSKLLLEASYYIELNNEGVDES